MLRPTSTSSRPLLPYISERARANNISGNYMRIEVANSMQQRRFMKVKVVRQRSARLLAILSILLLTAVIAPPVHGAPKPEGSKVILTVRYGHDELASSLGIESVSIAHALTKAKREPASGVIGLPDVAVSLVNGQKESIYRLEPTGMLWDPAAQQRLVPDAATAHKLVAYANQLRSNHYGAMIEWSDVRKLVPLKQIFTITDMGTGMSFRVQRRAGSDHADVQPISKADSHMMKKFTTTIGAGIAEPCLSTRVNIG